MSLFTLCEENSNFQSYVNVTVDFYKKQDWESCDTCLPFPYPFPLPLVSPTKPSTKINLPTNLELRNFLKQFQIYRKFLRILQKSPLPPLFEVKWRFSIIPNIFRVSIKGILLYSQYTNTIIKTGKLTFHVNISKFRFPQPSKSCPL